MKKRIMTFLAILTVLCLCACGSKGAEPSPTLAETAPGQEQTDSGAGYTGDLEKDIETLREQLEKVFAAEYASEPKLTPDGQVDLSDYTTDELYEMLGTGFSPNEEAGIDPYAYVLTLAPYYEGYAKEEVAFAEPDVKDYGDAPMPDDGFVMEEPSPELMALYEELGDVSYEDYEDEVNDLAEEMESLQDELDAAMQQLQNLGIDLSQFGIQKK